MKPTGRPGPAALLLLILVGAFASTSLAAVAAGSAAAAGVAAAASAAGSAAGTAAAPVPPPSETDRDTVTRLVGEALLSNWGLERLADLCDRIGHRLSNSPQMREAIEWSRAGMTDAGLTRVRTEPVMVPNWTRGPERARVVEPVERELHILGLGLSVATPPGGIIAPLVVVRTFPEMEALGEAGISGRIVLFDYDWTSYGAASDYRNRGPSRAAVLGARATLVRSLTPRSLDTPHTGVVLYARDKPQIPAAAVTVEDAAFLRRLAESGKPVTVHLEMDHRRGPDAPSANVLGEVRGRELPDEIVVLSAHLDSWDVGQGAQDDGTGLVMTLEAARLIAALPVKPRRTIRVVHFADEEMGGSGGDAYRDAHRDELPLHVAAIESDYGCEPATGLGVDVSVVVRERAEADAGAAGRPAAMGAEAAAGAPGASAAGSTAAAPAVADTLRSKAEAAALQQRIIGELDRFDWALSPLGADRHVAGGSGVNLGPSAALGMLGFWFNQESSRYFDVHHSPADTYDKVVAAQYRKNVAVLAVMAWLIADAPERLLPWPDSAVVPGATR